MATPGKTGAAVKRRSPQETTDDERRALWVAVRDGDAAKVAAVLDTGMSPRFFDDAGDSPLHMAARSDFAQIVELLLDAGADIDAVGPRNGATALHKAAWAGAQAAADILITRGADLHIQDEKGDTPLHKAMITGRETITYHLARAGARPDIPNNNGWSPAEVSEMTNHRKATEAARLGQSMGHADRYKHVYRKRRTQKGPQPR